MRKAVSLTEMLIAVSLMGVVILGAVSFDFASRKLVNASERRAVVMNDLNLILDYLQKDINNSVGCLNRPAANFTYSNPPRPRTGTLICYHDTASPATPSDFSDDTVITYLFRPDPDGEVGYISRSGVGVLTNRVVGPEILPTTYDQVINANDANGVVTLNSLVLRYDPTQPADNSTNPEVSVSNVVFFPMSSSTR